MTYEATRGYYTSRLMTACNLLASNTLVTHSKVRNRLLNSAVAIMWVKVLILLMVASYKEKCAAPPAMSLLLASCWWFVCPGRCCYRVRKFEMGTLVSNALLPFAMLPTRKTSGKLCCTNTSA
ncbi:hypothetical protein CFC21_023517 [Triticum aestivum]|uniref:Uncharacterized protein n=2 Tax=Triticum aestivum TaxID=4565 RepID=A0A9R1EEF4_WHEAT|nr:hypothetical protein CFC21_023517 [Triticum aestivum]